MLRRFPETCLRVTDALDHLGAQRYGEGWRPFCRACLERAEPAGARFRHGTRPVLSLLLSAPLAAAGWISFFRGEDLADERYLTARLTFSLLAWLCALLMAAYGVAGIGRRRGWFHRHPAAGEAQTGRWRAVAEDLEARLRAGTLRGYALTQDGALHPIPAEILSPELARATVRGADRNAVWTVLRKRLRLRNAPSGAFVIDRADLARESGGETSSRGFHTRGRLG